jgi:hypothetical protein
MKIDSAFLIGCRKKFIACGVILLLLMFSCTDEDTSVTRESPVVIQGNITTHTIWGGQNRKYRVPKDIVVERGALLTIQSGVEVLFAPRVTLIVEGGIHILGDNTETGQVTLSCSEPDRSWAGIYFNNTNNADSIIQNADIISAAIGIHSFSSSPRITCSTFTHNKTAVKLRDSVVTLSYNRFIDSEVGLDVANEHAFGQLEVAFNQFQGNSTGIKIGALLRGYEMVCHSNNFVDNEDALVLTGQYAYVNARNNWWGTPEIAEVKDLISGDRDDRLYGDIDYMPIASEAFPLDTCLVP